MSVAVATGEVDDEIHFEIPEWASRPPAGMHLDVTKNGKLVQKLMIDEKRVYFFGRNPKMCDFTIDHASCSRAHAALLYHKFLERFFLVDLGSSHGSYIGKTRIESKTPVNIPMDSTIQFGASTRQYILRSKIKSAQKEDDQSEAGTGYLSGGGITLPIKEEDLQNLTEYNTALNRRIASVAVTADDDYKSMHRKKHRWNVNFMDEDQVINPEDVDPSVGRFRNLVSTVVIPSKRARVESDDADTFGLGGGGGGSAPAAAAVAAHHHSSMANKHNDAQHPSNSRQPSAWPAAAPGIYGNVAAKIGLSMPNPAPDVDLYKDVPPTPVMVEPTVPTRPMRSTYAETTGVVGFDEQEDALLAHRKKKYAKEAWPGKKPGSHLLLA